MDEYVILVAIQVRGNSRAEAMGAVMDILPNVGAVTTDSRLECWWIAEDDRTDRSDCDSAVFVRPGAQAVASEFLAGSPMFCKGSSKVLTLTPKNNIVPADRDGLIWTEPTEI